MDMNIKTFSDDLFKRMKDIATDGSDDLVTMGRALSMMRELLSELRQFTAQYKFVSAQEEIAFFKETKPMLLSHYFYYKKKFKILLFDSFRDRKSRMENYYRILQKLQRFAEKHQEFYQ